MAGGSGRQSHRLNAGSLLRDNAGTDHVVHAKGIETHVAEWHEHRAESDTAQGLPKRTSAARGVERGTESHAR